MAITAAFISSCNKEELKEQPESIPCDCGYLTFDYVNSGLYLSVPDSSYVDWNDEEYSYMGYTFPPYTYPTYGLDSITQQWHSLIPMSFVSDCGDTTLKYIQDSIYWNMQDPEPLRICE